MHIFSLRSNINAQLDRTDGPRGVLFNGHLLE